MSMSPELKKKLFIGVVLGVSFSMYFLLKFVYFVHPGEQYIVLQFGRPIAGPITAPGAHFKMYYQDLEVLPSGEQHWTDSSRKFFIDRQTTLSLKTSLTWEIVDAIAYFEAFSDQLDLPASVKEQIREKLQEALLTNENIDNREDVMDPQVKDEIVRFVSQQVNEENADKGLKVESIDYVETDG